MTPDIDLLFYARKHEIHVYLYTEREKVVGSTLAVTIEGGESIPCLEVERGNVLVLMTSGWAPQRVLFRLALFRGPKYSPLLSPQRAAMHRFGSIACLFSFMALNFVVPALANLDRPKQADHQGHALVCKSTDVVKWR